MRSAQETRSRRPRARARCSCRRARSSEGTESACDSAASLRARSSSSLVLEPRRLPPTLRRASSSSNPWPDGTAVPSTGAPADGERTTSWPPRDFTRPAVRTITRAPAASMKPVCASSSTKDRWPRSISAPNTASKSGTLSASTTPRTANRTWPSRKLTVARSVRGSCANVGLQPGARGDNPTGLGQVPNAPTAAGPSHRADWQPRRRDLGYEGHRPDGKWRDPSACNTNLPTCNGHLRGLATRCGPILRYPHCRRYSHRTPRSYDPLTRHYALLSHRRARRVRYRMGWDGVGWPTNDRQRRPLDYGRRPDL